MAEELGSANNGLMGAIFQKMVMEQAMKDKSLQVQKQMVNEQSGEVVAGHQQDEYEKDDSDSDFDDDDEVLRGFRAERMKELKAKHEEHAKNMAAGHGQYEEITEEQFLPKVTKSKFIVVHFFHKDFERCKIMDHHLNIISKQHTESKFCSIDAEKCPFFVAKLQIQMLPTVICFMDGVAFDRIVGFEELGGKDEFPTLLLTRKLVKTGCLKALSQNEVGGMKIKKDKRNRDDSEDDDEEGY